MTAISSFLVNKSDIHNHKLEAGTIDALAEGEALMKIDHFSFTANNVTYAAFGDAMKYWDFFPAEDGYGIVPVWGFAEVVESKAEGVSAGERFYGYYPMASHLKVSPVKVSPAGFADGAAHRGHLSPIYNFYTNTKTDPAYRQDMEGLQMVFRPLFMTSFLIDDFLEDNGFFGAEQVVLSSASSKTAYGLAFLLAQREGIEVIGLTSPGNVAFCNEMGSYNNVVTYDDVASLDAAVKTVYVDMAGSGPVRESVHSHFNSNLAYSCSVGASHWDQMGSNKELPGPAPTLFFAPAQGQKRAQDWGQEGLQKRTGAAWMKFIAAAGGWTEIVTKEGTDTIAEVYSETASGKVNPQHGNILSF
jgi:hypothetical protein